MTKTHSLTNSVEFVIAIFGKGRLVRTAAGYCELRGGTLSDLLEAREWVSLFMPEAVVRVADASRRG